MKKLFSPFGRNILVALTSGHTFVVKPEPVDVPDMYVAEAMARGAMEANADQEQGNSLPGHVQHQEPQSVATSTPPVLQSAAQQPVTSPVHSDEELALQRAAKIKEALIAMVDGSNEADFTAAGVPQLARVKAHTGFTVTRAEVDAVWAEVSAKL